MKRFEVCIDTYAVCKFVIEAENEDEANDKAEELIQSEDFFTKYRKECDIFDPEVGTIDEVREG